MRGRHQSRRQEEREHFWNELCHYCRGKRRSHQILLTLVGPIVGVAERKDLLVSAVCGVWGLESCFPDILCAFLSVT